MLLECPACRKWNEPGAGAACQRCGCDLGWLQAVRRGAARHLDIAAVRARSADWSAALLHAERSWSLRHSPEAARIAFVVSAILRDGHGAALWHPRSKDNGDADLPG